VIQARVADLGVKITQLVTDSRMIQPGDTFVAYLGERLDGRKFIAQAIAQGANAVIWESHGFRWHSDWQIPNVGIEGLRDQAGYLADVVYGQPSEKLWMVGVTGTNGKTSTSHWIGEVLTQYQQKCALIGTLGNGFKGDLQSSVNTTPDAIHVHKLLADYVQQDAKAVAMEVSSHALTQGRVNGVRFDVALLTNLSRDHLDYHGTMAHYAASKRQLFESSQLKFIVLNLDDLFGRELAEQLRDASVETVGYGLSEDARHFAQQSGIRMVYGHSLKMNGAGLELDVHSSWGSGRLHSGLIGRFNAENLLGVLAVLLVSGISLPFALNGLSAVQSVSGRMQRLGGQGTPAVIVDYAHTPDALEKVLVTLREICPTGKLYCVFGCGGDRDRGKRPVMGRIAERNADVVVVTSDNPRTENPNEIIAEVVQEMHSDKFLIIEDRAKAIRYAVQLATEHDVVLVAGKGHENYQEIQGVRYDFSDIDIAFNSLQKT
jgi:UDP-N-acetylmuramoyl-L-alanyl-D-glutamate--2,6-diaminopimelate ligase